MVIKEIPEKMVSVLQLLNSASGGDERFIVVQSSSSAGVPTQNEPVRSPALCTYVCSTKTSASRH